MIFKTFTKGIFQRNPVFVLLLGLCPTLAVSTSVENAMGMGAASTFVLVFSNLLISLIKNFHSQEDPDSLLYCGNSYICHHGGVVPGGISTSSEQEPGTIRSPDCGELYHSGTGRSIRVPEPGFVIIG